MTPRWRIAGTFFFPLLRDRFFLLSPLFFLIGSLWSVRAALFILWILVRDDSGGSSSRHVWGFGTADYFPSVPFSYIIYRIRARAAYVHARVRTGAKRNINIIYDFLILHKDTCASTEPRRFEQSIRIFTRISRARWDDQSSFDHQPLSRVLREILYPARRVGGPSSRRVCSNRFRRDIPRQRRRGRERERIPSIRQRLWRVQTYLLAT